MESIIAAIVTAVITGSVTLCGTLIANGKNQAVMATKIDLLAAKVEKHNNLIERMYKVEAKLDELQHDFDRMECDGK